MPDPYARRGAARHHPQSSSTACTVARRRHRPSRHPVLDAVEDAFARLAAEPQTVHVRTAMGPLPIGAVRSVLTDPDTPGEVADAIWRALIGRARAGGAEWLLAATGCALVRIRSGIWHATRDRRVDRDEAAQAALVAFTEAVLTIEPLPLRGVLDELVRHARNAAQTVADRAQRDRLAHRPLPASIPPPAPAGHVDFLLADLVREGVITAAEADLIGRHRIEGTSLRRLAASQGTYMERLRRQLISAEARVVAALTEDGREPDSGEKSSPRTVSKRPSRSV
jgi:hypothetical protein